jgi:ABC-type antimicrobial peptide transport system permease subunit
VYSAGIREAIQSVDRNAGIISVKTMNQIMDESLWQRRLWSVLVGAFGTLALILAGVGIYGLLAFLVKQRTREIGVRMALGAKQSSIVALILGQGVRLLAAGVVAGLIAGYALKRGLSALLFSVTGMDPATLLGAMAVLSLVALVACYIPARRASSLDPLIALREE